MHTIHTIRRSEDRAGARVGAAAAFPLADEMAIDPRALGGLLSFMGEQEKPRAFELVGSVGVVSVEGALLQRASYWWDGYDAIAKRFAAAIGDSRVGAVILRFNSPGGYISGLFECIHAMRQMKVASGKRVYAVADEYAFSAAYALATVADEIYLPPTGGVGSIGAISTLVDFAKANEIAGVNVKLVYSGARKADGHPEAPLTEEAISRAQARVDELGRLFAKEVAAARPLSVEEVQALQAACLYGPSAVKASIADGVKSLAEVVKLADGAARKVTKSAGATGASGQEKIRMSVAIILGLAADASEKDIAERAGALRSVEQDLLRRTGKASAQDALTAAEQGVGAERSLLSITGQTSVTGALGVIDGWKAGAAKAEEHAASLAKMEAERTTARVEAAITKAKTDGRVTDAELTSLREQIFKSPDWAIAYLGSKPRVVPGHKSVEPEDEATEADAGGTPTRAYEDMSNMERAALKEADPKAFKRVRDNWETRGAPRGTAKK